jgi:hypothetical protein
MKKAHVILTWAFFFFAKEGCPQTTFNKAIDNPNYSNGAEFAYSIININDTICLISSSSVRHPSSEISLLNIFIDSAGVIDITKELYISNKQIYTGLSGSLIKNEDDFIMASSVNDLLTGFSKGFIVKFNIAGDTIFFNSYGADSAYSVFYGTQINLNNDYLGIGVTGIPNSTNQNFFIVKIDTNGNLIFQKEYGGIGYEIAYMSIEYSSNKNIIFGRKYSNNQNNYPWVLKIDSMGNLIDEKWFIGGNGHPKVAGGFGATKGINGDIVVTGSLDTIINVGDAQYPIFFGIMDTNFNFNIKYAFNGAYPVRPYIIKQIKDSSYVAVGYKEGAITGCIAKVSKDGELLWQREYIYKQYGFNYFADFQETKDGGFIITGATNGDTSQDIWLVKLDSLGLLNDSLIVNNGTVLVNSSTNILQLYPNPTQSQLHLKIFFTQPQYEMAMLTVYDMVGKQILSENIILQQGKANHTVNVSNLPSGNYIAIVQAGGEVVKQRFVRE